MLVLAWSVASLPEEGEGNDFCPGMKGNLSHRDSSGMHGGARRRIAGRVSVQPREEQGAGIHQGTVVLKAGP